MPQPPRLDYRNQDLQNRSFKHQNLAGADFSGADIRGCNFSGANLTDANFQRVKTGQSRRQSTSVFAGVVAGAFAGIAAGVVAVAVAVTIDVTGAFAIAGDVAGVVAVAVAGDVIVAGAFGVAIAGTFAVAGVFGVAGTFAIDAFSRDAIVEGMAWSGLAVLLAGFAIYSFRALIKTICSQPGTIFEDADLTNASFAYASIQNTDFSGATLDFVNWTDASFVRCHFPQYFAPEIR